MLVPVIPNIPFFFVAWRAYSHWKGRLPLLYELCHGHIDSSLRFTAYKAATYLTELVKLNAVHPVPSEAMDDVYQTYSPTAPDDAMLISRGMVPKLLLKLKLLPAVTPDFERAVEQARLRMTTEEPIVSSSGELNGDEKDKRI